MNNTTNPLLTLGTEEIEQLLKARSTFDKLAQKFGLNAATRVSNHQVASRRSPNGANGHDEHRRKMSQAARDKISAGMRKSWKARRKKLETAPA